MLRQDDKIIGIALISPLVCLNIDQIVRAIGVDKINVCVDCTYKLSRLGWALINMGTHSIEAHKDRNLA